ncbi:hypothetical protein CQA66_04185 [Helicobacter aurati]|uniref:DUF8201 domain-containing protein n=1 Tax=Helicobacter aurati TaxID=137778 RepID=A0A3D8J4X1_9HELI|nr:hypothetical protein [Helicobacter aurati]RDU72518.1 hypothetical protein CQA66_04185 [Helicobacter aurati]
MEYLLVNAKIAIAVLLWIVATFGFGTIFVKIIERFSGSIGIKSSFLMCVDTKFNVLFKGLLGVFFLAVLVGIVNFFIPISQKVSVLFCIVGIVIALCSIKNIFSQEQKHAETTQCNPSTSNYLFAIFSFVLALLVATFFSFVNENHADTLGYHSGATQWVQEYPIVFGIANIHTRFGFNNILYNFAALSEVSNLFPSIRSFILNEVCLFYFCFAGFLALFTLKIQNFSSIFMSLILLWIPLVFWHFFGLYVESLLGCLGFSIVGFMLYCYESCNVNLQARNKHFSNIDEIQRVHFSFIVIIFLCFFAVYIKISSIFLLFCALTSYCGLIIKLKSNNKDSILPKTISIMYTARLCVFSCAACAVLGLAWALKGICLSGMPAYPAKVLHFPNLPWTIEESIRIGDIRAIHNWARVKDTENGDILIEQGKWLKTWFYTFLIKDPWQRPLFIAGIIIILAFLALLCCKKSTYQTIRANINPFSIGLSVGLISGVTFWFLSAPDPRFGYSYILPIYGIILAYNISICKDNYIAIKTIAFLHSKPITNFNILLGILLFCHIYGHMRSDKPILNGFKFFKLTDTQKIMEQKQYSTKQTESGLTLHFEYCGNAPLPCANYFKPNLQKGQFMKRDMYYINKVQP